MVSPRSPLNACHSPTKPAYARHCSNPAALSFPISPSPLPPARTVPISPSPLGEFPASHLARTATDCAEYVRDSLERTVLFWDTLRQRANNMLAHERAGKPPLLDFDYETLLDARRFERPANYALLRITRVGEDCLEDCLDPEKPRS